MDEPLRETSFLQDKLNQPEISGDLMSGRSAKVKYLNEKFESKKNQDTFDESSESALKERKTLRRQKSNPLFISW